MLRDRFETRASICSRCFNVLLDYKIKWRCRNVAARAGRQAGPNKMTNDSTNINDSIDRSCLVSYQHHTNGMALSLMILDTKSNSVNQTLDLFAIV